MKDVQAMRHFKTLNSTLVLYFLGSFFALLDPDQNQRGSGSTTPGIKNDWLIDWLKCLQGNDWFVECLQGNDWVIEWLNVCRGMIEWLSDLMLAGESLIDLMLAWGMIDWLNACRGMIDWLNVFQGKKPKWRRWRMWRPLWARPRGQHPQKCSKRQGCSRSWFIQHSLSTNFAFSMLEAESWPFKFCVDFYITFHVLSGPKSGSGTGMHYGSGSSKAKSFGPSASGSTILAASVLYL